MRPNWENECVNKSALIEWLRPYLQTGEPIPADVLISDIKMMPPTLTPPNEPLISGFDVIDTKTGKYPDLWEIALKEDWAGGLMYCDMEGFAIEEDGTLLLLDECGKHVYCPEGRFKIVPRPQEGEA